MYVYVILIHPPDLHFDASAPLNIYFILRQPRSAVSDKPIPVALSGVYIQGQYRQFKSLWINADRSIQLKGHVKYWRDGRSNRPGDVMRLSSQF
jgi:hypothetical protein